MKLDLYRQWSRTWHYHRVGFDGFAWLAMDRVRGNHLGLSELDLGYLA
jgi:hypothetical protein